MTRRIFYIALGATVGILVVRRLTSAAESLQPENVARKVVGSVQGFAHDVRAGMAEREGELRSALGIDDGSQPSSAAMNTAEIRRRFLAHFEARGHLVVPSASLVSEDPTLLLVNAGMVPFKPFFLGDLPPPAKRATSVQKVVRTIDIENVGKTSRHASFFQMCGNFSFGDYFKAGAIEMAWELLTSVDAGYGFDPERLWATVYLDDDEAFGLWQRFLPDERIQRRGKEDNYWSMGVPGPCGPCSEIYFDRGSEFGADGGPEADEERYLEVWNLVFMQYERGRGRRLRISDPARSAHPEYRHRPRSRADGDHPAGCRQPLRDRHQPPRARSSGELSGKPYGVNDADDVALRIVADHIRTGAMLVADGVTPSNEGRGYVLRRLLRRALAAMQRLGSTGPVAAQLLSTVREVMGPIYPELNSPVVTSVIVGEEDAFRATLIRGMALFETAVEQTKAAGSTTLSGERAFALHDTYGFPYELTRDLAEDVGLSIDEAGFQGLMQQQRAAAREDREGRRIVNRDAAIGLLSGVVVVSRARKALADDASSEAAGRDIYPTEAEASERVSA